MKIHIALILIILTLSCNFHEKDNSNQKRDKDNPITSLDNNAIRKENSSSIVPYTIPKTINELLTTVYVVDTLYRKVNSNSLGNDDDSFEIVLNDIVAIDLESNRKGKNKLFTLETHSNIHQNYEFEKNQYITHCIDSECDQVVVTKWSKSKNELSYVNYFKNIIFQKYGSTLINDIKRINNELYFLIETIKPSEGHELLRNIYVMKELKNHRFKEISLQSIIEPYGKFEGSCKFKIDSNNLYVVSQIESISINSKVNLEK